LHKDAFASQLFPIEFLEFFSLQMFSRQRTPAALASPNSSRAIS
jgi:hypothetical protein